MTDNCSRRHGSAREGGTVAHAENKLGQNEERAHESWRTHVGTRPGAMNGERSNHCWIDDGTGAGGMVRSQGNNHESEELTNCLGTIRLGREVRAVDSARCTNTVTVGHPNRRRGTFHPGDRLGLGWGARQRRSFFSCENYLGDDGRRNQDTWR